MQIEPDWSLLTVVSMLDICELIISQKEAAERELIPLYTDRFESDPAGYFDTLEAIPAAA